MASRIVSSVSAGRRVDEPDPTPSFQGSPAYSGSDSGNDTDTSSTNEADVEAGLGTESIAGEISNAANQAAKCQTQRNCHICKLPETFG